MSLALLATKLYIPRPRPDAVSRDHLIMRLNAGLHHRLSLISAPPGSGKTTLLSLWIATSTRPAAWLALDQADNDPARFLSYLVAALQTLRPTIGAEVTALLQSAQPPPITALLPMLLNEIARLPQPIILVLDDYHVLDARPIDQALAFLIEHLPAQLHLVIATREDPPLPLARLRVRGQLTELRAADLRFTPDEAAIFLTQVMGLNLAAADVDILEDRTEGWIAGLQLAALSMQGQQDIPGFIRAFTGEHRYILDYLLEEVLQRQSEELRNFLLQTAILDRLSAALCDAVTDQRGGQARLEMLERGNFFVVALDDTRQWYRYHHLFGEVLVAQLRAEQPDLLATLHQRASMWYEQHASLADAIRHALAAEDFVRAADLIERAAPALRQTRQEATLLAWLMVIPDDLISSRPVLSVHYAWALLSVGAFADVEHRLRDAERWLDRSAHGQSGFPTAQLAVVDEQALCHLPGTIALYRAALALAQGHIPDTMAHAQQALALLDQNDQVIRGAATALLGLAYWTSGELEAAHQAFTDGMLCLQKAGHIADAIGGASAPADIRTIQGRLHEAWRIYERALQLAREQPLLRGTADMYVGMSELARERNDLQAAEQLLQRSRAQGEHTGFPRYPYRWRVALARLRQAQGDLSSALDLLDEAERLYVSDFFPNVRPIAALRARMWLAQARLADAQAWVREQKLSVHDKLSYLREFEHITLARVLMAAASADRDANDLGAVLALLERLLQAAELGKRMGSMIEILVLQTLVHQMQGDTLAALVPLSQALLLAEPEGYVRIFVDEGQAMALVLEVAAKHGIAPDYVRKLLAAFGTIEQRASVSRQGLIEPLSEREGEVLRLLRSDLSGPEIAGALVVSLNTLRTHTRNIYAKLGVNSRRAAVRRAEELALF